jgi:hypothetical protein
MAEGVLCGRCGSPLAATRARCARCGARSTATFVHRRKSPLLAAALAVVPGLGHLYVGHWPKALGYLAGLGGAEFVGADLDLTGIGALVGVPTELGGFALWAFSIVDAYRAARAANRVAELSAEV